MEGSMDETGCVTGENARRGKVVGGVGKSLYTFPPADNGAGDHFSSNEGEGEFLKSFVLI
jgi:hypothetical protein